MLTCVLVTFLLLWKKYHDQKQPWKEVYFGLTVPENESPSWPEGGGWGETQQQQVDMAAQAGPYLQLRVGGKQGEL